MAAGRPLYGWPVDQALPPGEVSTENALTVWPAMPPIALGMRPQTGSCNPAERSWFFWHPLMIEVRRHHGVH